MNQYLKVEKWRCPAYLRFVSDNPCSVCEIEDGTIVPHHFGGVGKGIGTKEDDFYTVPICHACHADIDKGLERENIDKFYRTALHLVGQWLKDGKNG